jgi:hypothetical protein
MALSVERSRYGGGAINGRGSLIGGASVRRAALLILANEAIDEPLPEHDGHLTGLGVRHAEPADQEVVLL